MRGQKDTKVSGLQGSVAVTYRHNHGLIILFLSTDYSDQNLD